MSTIPTTAVITPTHSIGTYVAGHSIGGVITIQNICPINKGFFDRLNISANGAIVAAPAIYAYLFSANPINSEVTDNQAVNFNASDLGYLVDFTDASITLLAPPSGMSGGSGYVGKILPQSERSGEPIPFSSPDMNMYLVLIAAADITTITANDFFITIRNVFNY